MEELTQSSGIEAESQENPLFSSYPIPSQEQPLLATPDHSYSYYRFPLTNLSIYSQDQELIHLNTQESEAEVNRENYIALPFLENQTYEDQNNNLSPILNGLRLLRTDSLIIENINSNTQDRDESCLTNAEIYNEKEEVNNKEHDSFGHISLKTWGVLVSLNSPLKLMLLDDLNCYTIGRRNKCNFRLKETHISGTHFSIERKYNEQIRGYDFILKDLGSKNGTYLNSQKLNRKEDYAISSGDIIYILAKGKRASSYLRTSFMFLNKNETEEEYEDDSFDSYQVSEEGEIKEDGIRIRLAVNKSTLKKYKLKTICNGENKDKLNNLLLKEYKFYSKMDHKNITPPAILLCKKDENGLLFPQGSFGNLGQYLKRNNELNIEGVKKVLNCIFNALVYLDNLDIKIKLLNLSMLSIYNTEPFSITLGEFYQNEEINNTLNKDLIQILLNCIKGIDFEYQNNVELKGLNEDLISFIKLLEISDIIKDLDEIRQHKWFSLDEPNQTKRTRALESSTSATKRIKSDCLF